MSWFHKLFGAGRPSAAASIADWIERGDADSLRAWLEERGDPNIQVMRDNGEWCRPLHLAALHNRIEMLDLLLARGAQIEAKDKLGLSPLAHAVEADAWDAVELLVTAGADPLQRVTTPYYKDTPLYLYAIGVGSSETATHLSSLLEEGWEGQKPLVKDLLRYAMTPDGNGRTAYHYAAISNDKENGKYLLENGANPNVVDAFGQTPLHLACFNCAPLLASYLAEAAGARLSEPNNKGQSPLDALYTAMSKAEPELLPYYREIRTLLLGKGAKYLLYPEQQPVRGELMEMVSRNAHRKLEAAIKAGADVNELQFCKEGYRTTALITAIRKGRQNIIELLVESGADLNLRDEEGCSPLGAAFGVKSESLVRELLSRGADSGKKLNLSEDSGYYLGRETSVLMLAIYLYMPALALELVEAGANVLATNSNGETALHAAVSRNSVELIHKLLASGLDINVRSNKGNTPLSRNLHSLKPDTLKLLLSLGADPTASYYYYDGQGSPSICQALTTSEARADEGNLFGILLRAVPDVNVRDYEGSTPLIYAARMGRAENIQALLDRGADRMLVNDEGSTALHTAVYHGHEEIFHLLATADTINALNKAGQTPLDLAIRHTPRSGEERPYYLAVQKKLRELGGLTAAELQQRGS